MMAERRAEAPRRRKGSSPTKSNPKLIPDDQQQLPRTRAGPSFDEGMKAESRDDSSSSSSSYIDISRIYPPDRKRGFGVIRTFFTAPSERRRVKRRKSRRFLLFSNSSSSSVNSDLAYGTGYIRKRNSDKRRSTTGREQERENGSSGGNRKNEVDNNAAILEVGAGLAALARQQNRMDLMEARRSGALPLRREDIPALGQQRTRGLGPSRVTHTVDEDGWESASDGESEVSSIDSRLAYGDDDNSPDAGWRRNPPSRKSTIVDPRLFGPQNSLHGFVTSPVGFREVDDSRPLSSIPLPTTEPIQRQESITNNMPLQYVYPVPTTDPTQFDAARGSLVSGMDQPPSVSGAQSIPIQQPQPIMPVSQSVYDPIYATHTESPTSKYDNPSSTRKTSLAGAALAGVAGAAVGAAIVSDRRSDRDSRDDERRERRREVRRDDERFDSRNDRRERPRETRRDDTRYEKSEGERESRGTENVAERSDDRPYERRDRRSEPRDDRYDDRDDERPSREAIRSTKDLPKIDPFQFQVADDAFPTPTLSKAPDSFEDERPRTPAVVTVERVPNFARGGSSSSNLQRGEPSGSSRDTQDDDRGRTAQDAEALYRETEHFTAPIEIGAIGAAVAAVAAEEVRNPRGKFKKGRRQSYENSSEAERDLIQEQADRVYREAILARKLASHDDDGDVVPIISTPPGMEEHKKPGPYDAPNADFTLDHILDPAQLKSFTPIATRSYPSDEDFSFSTKDFDPASLGLSRPLLNLVRPTPSPSPMPEVQASRAPPKDQPKADDKQTPDTVTKSDPASVESSFVESPLTNGSKGVTWSEDQTNHHEAESPEQKTESSESPLDRKVSSGPVSQDTPSKKSSRWGAITSAFMGAGAGAAAAATAGAIVDTPKDKTDISTNANGESDPKSFEYRGITVEPEHDKPFEYRGVTVEPETHISQADPDQGPPPVGPKPHSPQPSRIPGAFEDDLDFTATVAAGLQDSGFDPNIVINDPTFRRRTSPPGSDDLGGTYRKPYAETVSDLGTYSNEPATEAERTRSREVVDGADEPVDLSRSAPSVEEEFSRKLNKKEKKKLDKREDNASKEITISDEPVPSSQIVEEPDSYYDPSKSSKKEKKKSKKSRKDSGFDDDGDNRTEDRKTRVTVPVNAFDDLQDNGASPSVDDWNEPKRSKKKDKKSSKRDSSGYDPDGASKLVGSADVSKYEDEDDFQTPKKKSKKNKGDSIVESSLAESQSSSEISRNGRISFNGNGHSKYDLDDDGGSEKTLDRAADEKSAHGNSFLAKAGTLGAGVGLVGAALAITAQQQHSKADNAEIRSVERSPVGKAPYSEYELDIVDPEINERHFRPSIDPQHGDLLPLPPSDPGSPSGENYAELPSLPESRPGSPKSPKSEYFTARERTSAITRKPEFSTPVKTPSVSAVPLKFVMGNRSTPSSPAFARSPTINSPALPNSENVSSPRSRSRPISWDNTKEYQPLVLLGHTRRGSQVQPDDGKHALPRSLEDDSLKRIGAVVPDASTSTFDQVSDVHDFAQQKTSEPVKGLEHSQESTVLGEHKQASEFSSLPNLAAAAGAGFAGMAAAALTTTSPSKEDYQTSDSSTMPPTLKQLEDPQPVESDTRNRSSYLFESSPPSKKQYQSDTFEDVETAIDGHSSHSLERPVLPDGSHEQTHHITMRSTSLEREATLDVLSKPEVNVSEQPRHGTARSISSERDIALDALNRPEDHFSLPEEQPHISQPENHVSVTEEQPHVSVTEEQPHVSLTEEQPFVSSIGALLTDSGDTQFTVTETASKKEEILNKGEANSPVSLIPASSTSEIDRGADAADESSFVPLKRRKREKNNRKGALRATPEDDFVAQSLAEPFEASQELEDSLGVDVTVPMAVKSKDLPDGKDVSEVQQKEPDVGLFSPKSSKKGKKSKKPSKAWDVDSQQAESPVDTPVMSLTDEGTLSKDSSFTAPRIPEGAVDSGELTKESTDVADAAASESDWSNAKSSKNNKKNKNKQAGSSKPLKREPKFTAYEPSDGAPDDSELKTRDIGGGTADKESKLDADDIGKPFQEFSTKKPKKGKKDRKSSEVWEDKITPPIPDTAVKPSAAGQADPDLVKLTGKGKKKKRNSQIWNLENEGENDEKASRGLADPEESLDAVPEKDDAQPDDVETTDPLTDRLNSEPAIRDMPRKLDERNDVTVLQSPKAAAQEDPQSGADALARGPGSFQDLAESEISETQYLPSAVGLHSPREGDSKETNKRGYFPSAATLLSLTALGAAIAESSKLNEPHLVSPIKATIEKEIPQDNIQEEKSEEVTYIATPEAPVVSSPAIIQRELVDSSPPSELVSAPYFPSATFLHTPRKATDTRIDVDPESATPSAALTPPISRTPVSTQEEKDISGTSITPALVAAQEEKDRSDSPLPQAAVATQKEKDGPTTPIVATHAAIHEEDNVASSHITGEPVATREAKVEKDVTALNITSPPAATQEEQDERYVPGIHITSAPVAIHEEQYEKDDSAIPTTFASLPTEEEEDNLAKVTTPAPVTTHEEKPENDSSGTLFTPVPVATHEEKAKEDGLTTAMIPEPLPMQKKNDNFATAVAPAPATPGDKRDDPATSITATREVTPLSTREVNDGSTPPSDHVSPPYFPSTVALQSPRNANSAPKELNMKELYPSTTKDVPSTDTPADTTMKKSVDPAEHFDSLSPPYFPSAAILHNPLKSNSNDSPNRGYFPSAATILPLAVLSVADSALSEHPRAPVKDVTESAAVISSNSLRSDEESDLRIKAVGLESLISHSESLDAVPRLEKDDKPISTTTSKAPSSSREEQFEDIKHEDVIIESGGKELKDDQIIPQGVPETTTADEFVNEQPRDEKTDKLTNQSGLMENDSVLAAPKTIDGFSTGFSEEQLSLAKQLQAEFGTGSKKPKKGKKSRSTSQTPNKELELSTSYFDKPQLLELDQVADTGREIISTDITPSQTPDGLEAGYKAEQVKLARQMQEEFSSGSKRSKKDKKRQSTSQSTKDDNFGSSSVRDISEEKSLPSAEIDSSVDPDIQGSLKLPEPEEYAVITKKSKKDKKRQSLSRSTTDDNFGSTAIRDMPEEKSLPSIEADPLVDSIIQGSSTPPQQDEFSFTTKKNKKDKKRQSVSQSTTDGNFGSEASPDISAERSPPSTEVDSSAEPIIPRPSTLTEQDESLISLKKNKKDKKKRQSLLRSLTQDEAPSTSLTRDSSRDPEPIERIPLAVHSLSTDVVSESPATEPVDEFRTPTKKPKKNKEKEKIVEVPNEEKASKETPIVPFTQPQWNFENIDESNVAADEKGPAWDIQPIGTDNVKAAAAPVAAEADDFFGFSTTKKSKKDKKKKNRNNSETSTPLEVAEGALGHSVASIAPSTERESLSWADDVAESILRSKDTVKDNIPSMGEAKTFEDGGDEDDWSRPPPNLIENSKKGREDREPAARDDDLSNGSQREVLYQLDRSENSASHDQESAEKDEKSPATVVAAGAAIAGAGLLSKVLFNERHEPTDIKSDDHSATLPLNRDQVITQSPAVPNFMSEEQDTTKGIMHTSSSKPGTVQTLAVDKEEIQKETDERALNLAPERSLTPANKNSIDDFGATNTRALPSLVPVAHESENLSSEIPKSVTEAKDISSSKDIFKPSTELVTDLNAKESNRITSASKTPEAKSYQSVEREPEQQRKDSAEEFLQKPSKKGKKSKKKTRLSALDSLFEDDSNDTGTSTPALMESATEAIVEERHDEVPIAPPIHERDMPALRSKDVAAHQERELFQHLARDVAQVHDNDLSSIPDKTIHEHTEHMITHNHRGIDEHFEQHLDSHHEEDSQAPPEHMMSKHDRKIPDHVVRSKSIEQEENAYENFPREIAAPQDMDGPALFDTSDSRFHEKDALTHHKKDVLIHHEKDALTRHDKDVPTRHEKDMLSTHTYDIPQFNVRDIAALHENDKSPLHMKDLSPTHKVTRQSVSEHQASHINPDSHEVEEIRTRESHRPNPSILPVVHEEEPTRDVYPAKALFEHDSPTESRRIDDANRDSAFVSGSPQPPPIIFTDNQHSNRDSGVHLSEHSPTPTTRHRVASADRSRDHLSWPSVKEDVESVDPNRSLRRRDENTHRVSGIQAGYAALAGAGVAKAAAGIYDRDMRTGSPHLGRHTPEVKRLPTPEHSQNRSSSVLSDRSSGTPPLRRSDRKLSGDLRSLSQRSEANLAKAAKDAQRSPVTSIVHDSNPIANEGRARTRDMADVYDGFGEGRIGSPRSPTRPQSVRRRQSMQVLDLESRVEQLLAENRMLAEAKIEAERSLHASQRATTALADRDAEIDSLKQTLSWLHTEVARLKEVNDSLMAATEQHGERYGTLESQHARTSRDLDDARLAHGTLSASMQETIDNEVRNAVQDKDRQIEQLLGELEAVKEQIRTMQRQILESKANDNEFLTVRDEDYFDNACQQLCKHVQQWVLRFSKFSDMRACRLTSEINNDKIIDRLDNAVLDGSDVDIYLKNRISRRDIFMSMTMTMVWEFVFTRYLFGMDREQRQKLKSLEKILAEVGPPAAVHQWRATTLTLLSKRQAFIQQRERDTEAVVQEIFQTLSEILPPPTQLEEQIQVQLRRVMKAAVELSIEMRTQRAEYMMLPPLQPEYDGNGDLARQVQFNAALMNELSGETVSNEELEEQQAVVKIVLFPLVVKRGDDRGDGDDEIVVCPAQVLVALPKASTRVFSGASAAHSHSHVSLQSNIPVERVDDI